MMNQIRIVSFIFFIPIVSFLVSCSDAEVIDTSEHDEEVHSKNEKEIKNKDILFTTYAEEIGFNLQTPTQDLSDAHTVVDIQGKVEEVDELHKEHVWVVITRKEVIKNFENEDFNYYLPLNNGKFSKEVVLHHGLGEYEVNIRVPSNKREEMGMYYDVATFTVSNKDEDIQREIEYTQYGVENQIELTSPTSGIGESEGSVFIEGVVPSDYKGDMILVQVGKDKESRQLVFPTNDSTFQGEVPLYFGKGYHYIQIQTFNEDDELYYEAANFYVNNLSPMQFAEVVKYHEYITRGIVLDEPTWIESAMLSDEAYRIAGEFEQTIAGTEDINYVIVTVTHLEEDLDSTFLIPVENYRFDGSAYFRFGPGNYEVVISVPDTEKQDPSKFYYQGVTKIQHQVTNIEDKRALLPGRGIESDDPRIIEQAKEITADLNSERAKAKAIFKFVAQHVSYDVEKAENDIFDIGDSALSTLDSGVGICQDYAFLTVALLRAIGMEAHFVEGDAGERHAWVEVKVDEEWLVMDPTWGAGYVQNGIFHFHYNEEYFDPDPSFLAETHTRDGIVY